MENKELMQQSRDLIVSLSTALQETTIKLENKTQEVIDLKEQLKTIDIITNTDEWFDGKEIAKLLGYKGYGRNTIYALLRDRDIYSETNEPYQQFVNSGYFKLVAKKNEKLNIIFAVTLISAKGIDFIRRIIDEHITTE